MLEELSATHAMSYHELGGMEAELVEDMWDSYQERTALDRIDADYHSTLYSLMANPVGEKDKVEALLNKLGDDVVDARIRVIEKTKGELEDSGVSEDGFRTDIWWEAREDSD